MNKETDQNSANYDGFSLVQGGLFYTLTSALHLRQGSRQDLNRTALAIIALTWVPVFLMTVISGSSDDTDTTISFSEDFLFHIRFLLVVPFLILIERIVDESFLAYIKVSDDLVPNSQQEAFNRMVRQLDRLTSSYIPEIIMLSVMGVYIFLFWEDLNSSSMVRNYMENSDHELKMAGWYYLLVCVPVFQFLVFRWLWRWLVWVFSMIRISGFRLQVDPLHADDMAGLAYLNGCPLSFSLILVGMSAILSAIIGIDVIYQGAPLESYVFPILVYVVFLPVILYFPLLLFLPKLIEARTYGVVKFGSLLRKHNLDYVAKWVEDKTGNKEPVLGSMDNSSLSDINGSYAPVQAIKLIPLSYKLITESFVLNVIPFIPLVFTYYSGTELFNTLIKKVIGG